MWALPSVIDIPRTPIFNKQVWSDFTAIPDAAHPFLKLNALPADGLNLAGLHFTALAVQHGIPACGYLVKRYALENSR